MTLQATYLGAGSIGASSLTPATDTMYAVPITLASDSWLVAVEAVWYGGVAGAAMGAAVYSDDSGPDELIAVRQVSAIARTLSADQRWLTFPFFVWLPAGTYYVGTGTGSGGGGALMRQDTGGSSGDGYTIDGNVNFTITDAEYSSATVTATTATYSIRALIIEDVGGAIDVPVGTATETELALPITADKPITVDIGTVGEAETALPVAAVKPITVQIGVASETEAALGISPSTDRIVEIGAASEAETALPILPVNPRIVQIGQASETELALPMSVVQPRVVSVGQAIERELALTVSPRIVVPGKLSPIVCDTAAPTVSCSTAAPSITCTIES